MEKKRIHFQVDQKLYERFHRVFPAPGEKTLFFRRMMRIAVLKQGEKNRFIEEIWRAAEEMYGGEEGG